MKANLGDKFTVVVPVDVHEDCTWEPGTIVEVTHVWDDDQGYDLADKDGEEGSFAPCDLFGANKWFDSL
jgi:bifunctional DNA-binding transcriptional regulator/antitoxin component of YhaV-PrlF toxin-antitoxin module